MGAKERAWGYVRVSTERQRNSRLSLDYQTSQIIKYCEYKGFDLGPATLEIDDNGKKVESKRRIVLECESAYKKTFRQRVGGRKLWENAKKGDHVLFCFLDRGFRNPVDCLSQCKLWKDNGILVHFLDVNVDTSTPTGELMIGILSALAKWESDRRGERLRASHAERRNKGIARFPIYNGFKVVRNQVVPCEKQRYLMWLFEEKRKIGWTLEKIAIWLNRNGICHPSREKVKIKTNITKLSIHRYTMAAVRRSLQKHHELKAQDELTGVPGYDFEAGKAWFEELMKKKLKRHGQTGEWIRV